MLALQHRSRQLAVRAATLQLLMRLWSTVDATRLAATIQPFADAAATVVTDGYLRSARTAAAYYLLTRPRGITTVTVPEVAPPAPELTAAKLRAAALSGILNGRRAGQTIEAATANGFVKLSGTASSIILEGGRDTIIEAARQDPAATGRWVRVAGANACAFCQSRVAEGPVYSDDTAQFAAHDHCGCAVEPEFESR
jgi:hypothetical protein